MAAPTERTPLSPVERWAVAGVVAVAVGLRFVTLSPLWLDEALSVNIAALPVGDIFEALRQDGHPPLYYLLLHGWIEVVGDGDVAVRVLSGIFGVAVLPLVWLVARRRRGPVAAAGALVVTAVTPYMTRYGTEARMYSLLSLLVLAAWLLADDLRAGPDRRRWIGLALLTGAALLTHYWAIYLGIAAVGALAWRWWRSDARDEAIRVGSALAAGAVLFVPWLPSFLYQATHTGTPWGTATRPTRAVTEVVNALGGRGGLAEAILFGFAVLLLVLLGLLGVAARPEDRRLTLLLDLRTTPTVRREVVVVVGAIAVGLAVGAVSSATFVARYASGMLPLLFVAGGVGLAVLPGVWPRRLLTGAVVALAAPGLAFVVVDDRTQGEDFAEAIEAHHGDGVGTDALVAFCPDQLGPSTLRYLADDVPAAGIPALERPTRIDWVDYAERNESADPVAVAADILERADGRTIWLVYSDAYRTYEGLCPVVFAELAAARPANDLVVVDDPDIFEHAALYRFDP